MLWQLYVTIEKRSIFKLNNLIMTIKQLISSITNELQILCMAINKMQYSQDRFIFHVFFSFKETYLGGCTEICRSLQQKLKIVFIVHLLSIFGKSPYLLNYFLLKNALSTHSLIWKLRKTIYLSSTRTICLYFVQTIFC